MNKKKKSAIATGIIFLTLLFCLLFSLALADGEPPCHDAEELARTGEACPVCGWRYEGLEPKCSDAPEQDIN